MDDLQNLFAKVKVSASKIAEKGAQMATVAGKKASNLAETTKLNIRIFDINTEIEILYKELGQLTYDSKNGLNINDDDIEIKTQLIAEKLEKIESLRADINYIGDNIACPLCNKACDAESSFCNSCGAKL